MINLALFLCLFDCLVHDLRSLALALFVGVSVHVQCCADLCMSYQKIKDACAVTGLSQYYLRRGCKDGTVPCIKSGTVYFVNVPALLEKLNKESARGIEE